MLLVFNYRLFKMNISISLEMKDNKLEFGLMELLDRAVRYRVNNGHLFIQVSVY